MLARTGTIYRLGSSVGFEPGGQGIRLLGTGWSAPEAEGFVWSDGPEAELLFSIATPARDVVCRLELMPFIAQGAVEQQRVEFYFNHFRVGYAELSAGRHIIAVYLPRELFMLRTAVLNLHIPGARSPLELGLSADERRLGIALWSFQIAPVQ
jgi:hypothetical protein